MKGRHKVKNKAGITIKCKQNESAAGNARSFQRHRDAHGGQGHEPLQAEMEANNEPMSDEEPDVFGHGGDLDQGTERQWDVGENNKCTATLGKREEATTRIRGDLTIDGKEAKVQIITDDGEHLDLCDVVEMAKGAREDRYAISLAEGKGRAVFTSEANADRIMDQCRRLRTRCAQCEGDVAAADVVKRQGCAHYVCGGCYAENRDLEHPQSGNWGATSMPITSCRKCQWGARRGGDQTCGQDQGIGPHETMQPNRWDADVKEGHRRVHKRSLVHSEEADIQGGSSRVDGPGIGSTAEQRMVELRERVRRRQDTRETNRGRGSAAEQELANGTGEEGQRPAPVTPPSVPEHNEPRTVPTWRWESRGCGCNGRIHYACVRRRTRAAAESRDSREPGVDSLGTGVAAEGTDYAEDQRPENRGEAQRGGRRRSR